MDAFELTTAEDLVRQHAPELIPQLKRDLRIDFHIMAFMVSAVLASVVLLATGATGDLSRPIALIVAASFTLGGVCVAELMVRRRQESKLAGFFRELTDSPWRIYEAVGWKFAEEIERQRARTLGPDSEWGRARRPLEDAAEQAARSVSYWQQRTAMDPANDVVRQQLDTAERLRHKFQEALSELDSRAQVLVTFFNECEARLKVLQFARQDYEEARKLGVLSERADDIIASAQTTLAAIASRFLSEAMRVGNALGGLERVGILNLAGTTPIDQIETLADRILENAFQERSALERLTRDVSG